MGSIKGFLVDASAERVWEILFERFDEIYIWSSDIEISVPDPDVPLGKGRFCEIDGFGVLKDTIYSDSPESKRFTFIRTGFPFHVKDIAIEWSVEPLGNAQCRVQNDARIHLHRTSRFIFHQPLLKRLDALRDQMIKDLRYFAERGETRQITQKKR
ncbi:MAG: hypothetical protein AB8G95_14195 [Anaerolineae bacterium]